MKHTLFILLTATLFILACGETRNNDSKTDSSRAERIANSLRDYNQLNLWVDHFDSIGDHKSQLLIRQKLGKVMRDRSDFEAAIKQHDTCIAMATELKDTLQLIIAYNNQGTNFRRLGDLHEASNNHYKALELCDKTEHDTSFVARKNRVRTYNGLGNVLLSLGNDSVAESLFRQALAGETELGSATGQAINYANIGAIKEDKGQIDSARIYYNLSMEKNMQTNNPVGISLCYQYLGHLDKHIGNTDSAMINYRRAFELGVKTTDVWHWLKPCEAMAEIFLEEHKNDSARKYIDIALDAATKIKSRSHLAIVYSLCAQLQEQTRQYDKAVKSIRQAEAYKDSSAIEQNQIHMQNLRVKYEADRWHNEINEAKAIAEYEKTMRQTVMWGSIIVFALIIIVAISQIRIAKEKQKTNRMLRKIDKERQDFYRGITHQLRTPLTVVNGMTGQLKKFIPADNEEAQREFEAVERKSNEIVNLVNEMILYNKGIIKEIEVSELGVRSEEFRVRSEELGVRSEELSLRSEGVKECRSVDDSRGGSAYPPEKATTQRADTQTCPYNNSKPDSSNSSTRQLVNLSTEITNSSTCEALNSSTCEALNSSTEITNYILVAEDDSDVALLITTILKNNGYNYVWAKDGMEAMEIADRQLPKLIITDIMMPRMDGLEFIKRIREDEEKSHLPIIVVSARAEDRDRLIGVEAGAEVYLGKPFKSEELMLRVRKMLEQREILRLKYSKQIEEADRKDAEEQHREINNADQQFMQKVDEFIYENIMDGELDANSLANSMSMSLTTLNRRIKAITDTNTTNYIRMKRLGRARQLLMNTNMPLGEIQAVCGFESPSYFSRAFKAEYDVTPSEFRKTSKG